MKCLRIDVSRKILPYLHGVLSAQDAKKIEQHLSRCSSCKAKANRLLEGDAFARLLPTVHAKEEGWAKLEAAIIKEQFPSKKVSASFLRACAVITMLSMVGYFGWQIGRTTSLTASNFVSPEYREVAIGDMPSNTEPHVVTEG